LKYRKGGREKRVLPMPNANATYVIRALAAGLFLYYVSELEF
jgi:hypothetical protein